MSENKLLPLLGPKSSDRVALVTGSSAGVGEKVALYLAKLGFKLVITGRDVQRIRNVAQNCRQISKEKVLEWRADLMNDSEVQTLLAKTIAEFGRLDALINCVQISIACAIGESRAVDTYDKVFATNVRSVVLLTKLALPYIERTKGCLIYLSSDSGLKPYESEMAFGISEALIDWFTKGVALEMKYKGITVLSLNSSLVMRPDFDTNPWFSTTLHSRM